MKCYYVLGLCFLSVVCCRNIDNNIDKTNEIDKDEDAWKIDPKSIEKILTKCTQIGGEVAAKKFSVALDTTLSCLNREVPTSTGELNKVLGEDADSSNSFCSKKRKSVRGCVVGLLDAVKDCCVEEEKYAPEFMFDAIDSLLDFICFEDSKLLKDIANANETVDCIEHIVQKIFSGNMTFVCTDNFKLIYSNDDDVITKPELCEDLITAKTCYSGFLTHECPTAVHLNKFLIGAFEAISVPCKDVPIPKKAAD